MLFSELAVAFRQLEETSSRSMLVRILADVFRSIDSDEGVAAIYLLQGRLAPPFVPLELSIGPRGVIAAIARAYSVAPLRVSQLYDDAGDLGSAAGVLAESAGAVTATPPSVHAVFDCLVGLARASGSGSVELKLNGLADLLATLDPLSVTYVCRIPLGTLRLGVGDLTILDSLSIAHSDSRTLRPELERAYNETSDLGLLAETLWTKGPQGVSDLGIRVGNPVRAMLAERLPSAEAILERLGPCIVENKYDGFRCQIHKAGDAVHIFSRNLEEMTASFPELVSATREQVNADTAIIEGEALAYNPLSNEYLPFQQTMRRRRKHGIEETAAELPLRMFAFDILYQDGENVTSQPLVDRRDLLQRMIAPGPTILLSEARLADDTTTLVQVFEAAIQNGLEGIMAKRPDSTYRAGARSYAWVKLKRAQAGHLRDTVDCVIIGYLFGRGRRAAFGVGALLVAVYDEARDVFTSVTKIGTGLSDEGWRDVRARCAPYERPERPARVESRIEPSVWVEPEVVIEVLADEITRSPLYTTGAEDGSPGYALRFPRLIGFRDSDKRPEDATTVEEIRELYQQQGVQPGPA